MKLLVTGGAGFIGSNFIKYMIRHYPDYEIINLDSLTYAGNLENLQGVQCHSHYQFIKGGIGNGNLVRKILSGNITGSSSKPVDVIINFAAESHVDRSISNPHTFVHTNVLGTQVLLDAAREFKLSKFVQISTDEVYGTLGNSGFFTEDTSLSPKSPYSASKASADLLVLAYHKTYGLPVNITRCSNNYGPYQFTEKFIPLMITNALRDRKIPVYGNGKNIRDWLHVEDHCKAIDLVLHKGRDGEAYNIGGNNEWANIDLIKKVLQILNKPETLIDFVDDRLGHDHRYAIDATKIREELGWIPSYEFTEGIVKTILWYIRNQKWWHRV